MKTTKKSVTTRLPVTKTGSRYVYKYSDNEGYTWRKAGLIGYVCNGDVCEYGGNLAEYVEKSGWKKSGRHFVVSNNKGVSWQTVDFLAEFRGDVKVWQVETTIKKRDVVLDGRVYTYKEIRDLYGVSRALLLGKLCEGWPIRLIVDPDTSVIFTKQQLRYIETTFKDWLRPHFRPKCRPWVDPELKDAFKDALTKAIDRLARMMAFRKAYYLDGFYAVGPSVSFPLLTESEAYWRMRIEKVVGIGADDLSLADFSRLLGSFCNMYELKLTPFVQK